MCGEDATEAQLAPAENLTTRQGLAESGDRMETAQDAMEAFLANHWLVFNGPMNVIGCHCGFVADPGDSGYGDSVVAHIAETAMRW